MPESEAKAARREGRWAVQRETEADPSHQRAPSVPVDPEEQLLCKVMHHLLTPAETDARCHRRKNAKALRFWIEASEPLTREKEIAKAKAA